MSEQYPPSPSPEQEGYPSTPGSTPGPTPPPVQGPPPGSMPAPVPEPMPGAMPGPMPGAFPGQPEAAAPVNRPASIIMAVRLMYVGALLSLIGVLVTFTLADTIREQVQKAATDAGTAMSSTALDTAVAVGVGVAVVSGLVGAALWLLMAWANGRGKSWGRIVASVLFGLSVLSFVTGLAGGTQPTLALVLSVLTVALGAFIMVLLWKKESSAYYAAQSAPRY